MVEAQTKNAAIPNDIDLRKIALSANDVFIDVIQTLESTCFEVYVKCFPDRFKDATKGINDFVESCVTSEIKSLNIPKEEADFVQCTVNLMISTYALENLIVEMVEGYRDETL